MLFQRNVKDGGYYDVIVCGAGPAGVGASLCAARAGMRVLLLDHAGCVGGHWTSGLLSIALDMPRKGGIPLEILDDLMKAGKAEWADEESYVYDVESMKHLLEQKIIRERIDLSLYSRVTDVQMEHDKITTILADGVGSVGYRGRFFVDATGHGTLAALAGCTYQSGHPISGLKQPASLEALVSGVPNSWQSSIHNKDRKRELREMLLSVGIECTYPSPLLFKIAPTSQCWSFAINHQYGVDEEQPATLTGATVEARDEIYRAVEALRRLSGWENFTLVCTAEQIGLRDNRRIEGHYRLTGEDCYSGKSFADGVVPAQYFIDVHELSPAGHSKDDLSNKDANPYLIPMRCMISREVSNLFMAGRCISGDFYAHASYRMTNTCCAIGEAVGVALSMVGSSADVNAVNGVAVREEMLRRGYSL